MNNVFVVPTYAQTLHFVTVANPMYFLCKFQHINATKPKLICDFFFQEQLRDRELTEPAPRTFDDLQIYHQFYPELYELEVSRIYIVLGDFFTTVKSVFYETYN